MMGSFKYYLIWLSLFTLTTFFTTPAQVFGDHSHPGGTGGAHTILGRIYFPPGHPPEQLKVKLENPNAPTQYAFSNPEGVFTFSSLEPGNYVIVVEAGNDFESATENLTIDKETNKNTARTFNVIIYLQPKGTTEAKPAVINAKLAQVPKNALEYYQKGLQAASENNYKKAVDLFNKAVEMYPNFEEGLSELGSAYLFMGDLDKALSALQKALGLNSDNLNSRLNYGIVLLNKKQMAEAETELRKVIAKKDELAIPHMYLGIAMIGLKQIDEAEAELKKAISLKKSENLGQAHKYLGGIYWQKKDFKQAAENLEKYLEYNPKAPDAERIRATIKDLRSKL
jgi:tetratricopeptide (TPR) repeat protein